MYSLEPFLFSDFFYYISLFLLVVTITVVILNTIIISNFQFLVIWLINSNVLLVVVSVTWDFMKETVCGRRFNDDICVMRFNDDLF